MKRLLKIHSEWSDRRIAEGLGVDHRTVGRYREKMAGGEIPHLNTRQGADGKTYPAQAEPETRPVAVREHIREIPVRQNGNHVATIAVPEEAEPDDIERTESGDYAYRVNGQVVGYADSYVEALERRTQAVSRMAESASFEECSEPTGLNLDIPGQGHQIDMAKVAEKASAIFKERNVAEGKEYLNPKDGGDVYGPDDVENILEAVWSVAVELGQPTGAGGERAAHLSDKAVLQRPASAYAIQRGALWLKPDEKAGASQG